MISEKQIAEYNKKWKQVQNNEITDKEWKDYTFTILKQIMKEVDNNVE